MFPDFMLTSEFGINIMKAWIHPAVYQLQTGGGAVMMWMFTWQTLDPL